MQVKRSVLVGFATVTLSLVAAVPAFARPAVLTGQEPGSRINVRSQPSTAANSPHYGLVGDRVEVLNQTRDGNGLTWYYVQFSSGAKGWVRGDFIRIASSSQTAYLTGDEPGSRVNVRSGPSTQSAIRHYGLVGDRVQVLRSTRGSDGFAWHYVRFASAAEGWVRSDFVQF